MPPDFEVAWESLHPAFQRTLELAYESLAAGGLAVGSVLTAVDDRIVAEGRNRAYDPPGGRDALQHTRLAHAEMNVLAAVPTESELTGCTLWSTQEPCAMCSAAASFTGVGHIRYLAPDPWAIAAEVPSAAPGWSVGPAEDIWVVSANLLFLHSIASRAGVAHTTVARNRELEPETATIVLDLISDGLSAATLTNGRPLTATLDALWDRIAPAAASRMARRQ